MAVDPVTITKLATTIEKLGTDKNGRWIILIAVLTPLILVLLILSSPFAIFFSLFNDGSSNSEASVQLIMQELQNDLIQKIEFEQNDNRMDSIQTIVVGSEDNTLIDSSIDVLSFFSVMNTTKDGKQVVYLDNKDKKKLEDTFWEMNIVQVDIDNKTIIDSKETTSKNTTNTCHKIITIDNRSASEMAVEYGFSDEQKKILKEVMLSSDLIMPIDTKMYLSTKEIENIKSNLPKDLNIKRKTIVENALSLVGKVNYFWGGKSLASGWDDRWGTPTKVYSEGSSTTGTVRPFGLDCSGYVTWIFANLGLDKSNIDKTIGHGATAQWNLSTTIDKSLVIEGDLVFLAVPNTRKINHVGIIVGFDEEGNILVAHCNAKDNNISVDTADEVGFRYFKRPAILIE
ncbi:C40 family peptidase [Vallitalea guaymasensis]|uniref:C40 family peptidase n=1 Tax=Vallitalea guaymasensis TaxID=1185412 RepID=A0A8J8MEF6_9FIRM|nr:NlpC/P60 family protein [Vallitalea guaymasensis]QUH31130.1 C40 family peptidase [Vallitalea guaymasensis]